MNDKAAAPQGADEDGHLAAPRPRRGFVEPEPVADPHPPARGFVETATDPAPAHAHHDAFRRPSGEAQQPGTPRTPEELTATARRSALAEEATPTTLHGGSSATTVERLDDGASPRRRWPLLVAAGLLPALAGGAWWLGRDSSPGHPVAVASPSVATSSAAPPAPSPAATQGLSIEAPGKGTVASIKQRLVKEGFTCESEGQPGMDSHMCTHYTEDPAMMAYIGGATGKRLGRVALSVQDGAGGKSPEALALQEWMAEQFIGDPARTKRVLAKTRTGTEDKYAETTDGPINARGSSDGSLVLFVEGWVPNRAQPERLLPARPLEMELKKLGYECGAGAEVTCQRTGTNFRYTLDYRVEEMQVTYLKLRTEATGKEAIVDAAAAEVQSVTSLFQQGPKIQTWLGKHRNDAAGATGFQDGLALDWYPGSAQKGGAASVFYLRESCWTDTVEPC